MQIYNASHGDRESLESFYLRLAGQASKCGWTEEIEKEVIRDIFIAKMRFSDIQRELCIRPGATVDDTLKSALLQEKGYVTASTLQKQNPSTTSNSANFTNSSNQFRVKQEPLMSIQSKKNVQNRMNRALGKRNFKPKNQQDQTNTQSKPCYFCGRRFTPEHKSKCQARGATCRNCGKKGHFAKCCNSNQVANVEQPDPDEEEDCSVLKISETSLQTETVKNLEVINSATGKTKCLRTTLKTRGSLFSATVDTGRPASFVNKRTAETLLQKDPNAKIISLDKNPLSTTYVDYNHKPIKLFGILEIDIYSNGWRLQGAKFLFSENRTSSLLGLDIQPDLGIVTTQLKPSINSINAISEEQENESAESTFWRNKFTKKYNDVFHRLGRSKNHKVFTSFKSPLIPIQEKGRRVPIHIQTKVGAEIKKLIKEGHIVKLDKCTSDHFVAPVVITAKKDGTVKLAMDAKPMNSQVFKNNFQMPNLLELFDSAAQIITAKTEGTVWFTSLDLKYTFSQLPLD